MVVQLHATANDIEWVGGRLGDGTRNGPANEFHAGAEPAIGVDHQWPTATGARGFSRFRTE